MNQPTLFEFAAAGMKAQAEVNRLCRTNDPQTSKNAAEKMVKSGELNRQEKEILYIIETWFSGKDFTTKDVAVKMLGYPYHKAYDICRKRFSGLHDKFKITLTGGRRDHCQVWKLL